MGRDTYYLSDVPDGERVVIICRRCERRGVYDRDRLIALYHDTPMPTVLTRLTANCTGRDAWGGCAAIYESPLGSRDPPILPRGG